MLHKILLFLLVFLISACSHTSEISPFYSDSQSDMLNRLDIDHIFATIEQLATEPRVAGTESERNVSLFLAEQLHITGLEVETQNFNFDRYSFPDTVGIEVEGYNSSLSPLPFTFTRSGRVTGEIALIKDEQKINDDLLDVKGKIVLVETSETPFRELVLQATESGAAAIVICFPEDLSNDDLTLGIYNDAYIPALALPSIEGRALADYVNKNRQVTGHFMIEGADVTKRQSQNIIAIKKAKTSDNSTNKIIIIGAHYDSVESSPGASDNASGTAVLLELSRLLTKMPIQSEIRFVFFGSEEIGIIGSENYVNQMSKDEIERTIAMFNLDMVGSADAGPLTMFTADGLPNNASKAGSKASEKLLNRTIELGLTAQSDHAPFYNMGIDAVLFSYFPLEKVYHSPNDTIDKISKKRLEDIAGIIGLAIIELTADNEDL